MKELFETICHDIKKYKKFFIPVIAIIVITLIYSAWYYYPMYIYTENERVEIVDELIREQEFDVLEEFIPRAFMDEGQKYDEYNKVLKAREQLLIKQAKRDDPLKITSISIYDGELYVKVRNDSDIEINYVKYDIYYYDGLDGHGNIIGTDWSNCSNPIPPNAITEMKTYVDPPVGTKSYFVKIKETN